MNELDRERLEEVRAWAEKEIEKIEIRRANTPMFDSFRVSTGNLMTKKIPNIVAEPQAAVRESVLELERNLRDSDQREAKAEEARRQRLAQAQVRTTALRDWLEAVS